MKKIVLTLALAAFAFAANAQFVIGGQIGFNTNGGKQWSSRIAGNTTTEFTLPNDVTTVLTIAPKFGYNLNEKMHVGVVLGFTNQVEKEYSNYAAMYRQSKDFVGWDKSTHNYLFIAPYFRYTFLQFNKISAFCEAQVSYGYYPKNKVRSYNTAISGVVDAHDATVTGKTTGSEFAFTVAPGLNYRISNHFSADLYIDLLGLAFVSQTTHYYDSNNGVIDEWKTTNNTFNCIASFNAETLRDHLNIFRLGFNYHF